MREMLRLAILHCQVKCSYQMFLSKEEMEGSGRDFAKQDFSRPRPESLSESRETAYPLGGKQTAQSCRLSQIRHHLGFGVSLK
jgi:hypothetical protein